LFYSQSTDLPVLRTGPPPPLPEPATFTGIDGADVDLDVVEELPADVRVEVESDGALAVDAAWRQTPLADDER